MTRTRLIIAALVLGTLAGLALRAAGSPALDAVAAAVLPLGQMWVRALQMTLIPLIFAMVTHGIASAVAGGNGSRWIGTTLSLFVVAMIVTVILCTILTETVLAIWPIAPGALDGLLTGTAPTPVPGFAQQIVAIIPDNPVAAAAQGQIFPLVLFGLALGYEDLNDHDQLRHDPMMAILAGKLQARREDCAPVAGKVSSVR